MQTYAYKARTKTGSLVTGEIKAENPRSVMEKVASEGYFPLSVKRKGLELNLKFKSEKKPKDKEIAVMTRQFQIMFAVGTPMDRIMDTLAKQSRNPSLKAALTQIQADVASGTRVSAAFRRFPQYFNELYTSMLAVGEAGGILDRTLKEMAAIIEKEAEINARVKSAMMYPKIVTFILLCVTWGMLVFVIPPFKDFYDRFGAELPLPTKIVMGASDILTGYWYFPLTLVIIGVWAYRKFSVTPKGKRVLGTLAFNVPVFGRLNILVANSRFGHLVSALYRAGVPLTNSLDVVSNTIRNIHYAEEVQFLKTGLEHGRALSKSMEQTKYFEPMVQEACAVGEKTGKIDELLEASAVFYDNEIDDTLKNLSTLIEPFMLVVLFGLVLLLALAVYLPIWNISKVVLNGGS